MPHDLTQIDIKAREVPMFHFIPLVILYMNYHLEVEQPVSYYIMLFQ